MIFGNAIDKYKSILDPRKSYLILLAMVYVNSRRTIVFLILTIIFCGYLVIDYLPPKRIKSKKYSISGIDCRRAKELIVQQYDSNNNLWATRGMIIYKLNNNDSAFVKIARVPTGFSLYWLNNFSLCRKYTHRIECTEILVSSNGSICALSAGKLWYRAVNEKKFKKSLTLPNFGINIGRGAMSTGLASSSDSLVFLGEYFKNPNRESVNIYKSRNNGQKWDIAYTFGNGEIRHIHAIQKDNYKDLLWVCTGDGNNESMIGWTNNNFRSINIIGKGSQNWRTCQLVFTDSTIYWGTDTGNDDSGIFKWNREKNEITKVFSCDGAVFFGTRLRCGLIVMTTNREGLPNEKDDKTRIYILNQKDRVFAIECGSWSYKKKGFRSSFGRLRVQRNQGSGCLAVTFLNQKEIPNGELLIIDEYSLKNLDGSHRLFE